jgi:hypothetical protein
MADIKSSVIPTSAGATSPAELSAPELAQRINDQLKEIQEHAKRVKQTVLRQAVSLGELLLQAKAKVGHGKFKQWLDDNCELSERSAQRYMALKEQWPKIEAWLKEKSATVADLSLRKAEQIIAPQSTDQNNGGGSGSDSTTTSDGYDKLAEELIGSLEKMKAEEAEAAAQNTIRNLVHTVSVKKGVNWVPQFSKAKKAA